jgi:hypothetical protein
MMDMEGRNLSGINFNSTQLKAIKEKMDEVRQKPVFHYPWNSLERDLKTQGLSKFPMIGYGSLVNIKSAAVTLQDKSLNRNRPVIAFGARRIFNYIMPKNVERYGPVSDQNRAALNVHTTKKITDTLNGILFEITLDEISAIRSREIGYDLVPVATINWNENNNPPFLAYILRCLDKPHKGKNLTSSNIVPHKKYYQTCRDGALQIGKDFLQFWLATTYLADGVTPVSNWEVNELPEIGK